MGFKDRYTTTNLQIMGTAITFAKIVAQSKLVPNLNVQMVLTKELMDRKMRETDSYLPGVKVTEDPKVVMPIVEFLRKHSFELLRTYKEAVNTKEPQAQAEFEAKKKWLHEELDKLQWKTVALTKQISIVVALSGEPKRVRVPKEAKEFTGRILQIGSSLNAWGNQQLFTMPIKDFFFPSATK